MGNHSHSRESFPASYVAPSAVHRGPSDLSKTNFTQEEWQYLTVDQALEDFAVFAKGFTLPSASRIKLKSADALRPQNTPWIVVGASYPGVRATLLRVRNPEIVFASWASSAPIQAQINMASYYEAIQRALPSNCSADWVAVTKYVDDVLMGNNTTDQIRVKRALYTARMSGPGGNTTLVQQLSDSAVAALPSDDMAGVLLDPLLGFQVSSSLTGMLQWDLTRSRVTGYHLSTRSATAWRLATSQLTSHREVLMLPRAPTLRSTRLWSPSLKLTTIPCTGVRITIPMLPYAFPLPLVPHPLNQTHLVSVVLLGMAVLLRARVLPGRGSK